MPGGYDNSAFANFSAIAGGESNKCRGAAAYSTVAGGLDNTIGLGGGVGGSVGAGAYAVIGGGQFNVVEGLSAVVGGGEHNTATGDNSAVVGGSYNLAAANFALVGGGFGHTANGEVCVCVCVYARVCVCVRSLHSFHSVNRTLSPSLSAKSVTNFPFCTLLADTPAQTTNQPSNHARQQATANRINNNNNN